MKLTVFFSATKLWLTHTDLKNRSLIIRMQFENISIHCENGHTVESCEITDTVALSARCSSNAET